MKRYIVVEQYKPPECPKNVNCPPPERPHLWIVDDLGEKDKANWLLVVGYAQSQQDMDEARENAEKGKAPEVPEEEGEFVQPVVYDWQNGQKYTIKGHFTRASMAGFLRTDGILEYLEHKCLNCPPPEEKPAKGKAKPAAKAGAKKKK